MPLRPYRPLLATALMVLALAGCSSTKDELEYVERPPETIYAEAEAAMKAGTYKTAAKLYDEVERQHPYSQWATKAQLMAAYAHYEDLKYDDAILALDRFIQLHPGAPEVAYAYYMRALAYYEQITDVRRDQRMTRNALNALQEVVRRFPETEYARDAKLKIDLTNDHLAGKEMEVGRFYLRQGQYTAAIGRFRAVIENFQTTSHTPEALHRLVECYLALGITDEARTAAAVLGHNYPGSEWYMDSYALLVDANVRPARNEQSWISRALSSLSPF
ncbi:outer membrane protein assembly factor BamD [Azospirillum sp. RWY-5-1]|uniref:Outer membrane protein assembly factor BamD n=1 Tax=Azospirillum oleiclasticum TaxID=2735135 RepID=A0ABX2TF91_9PROT|nr:outer membrane protein assembly factor BamD [Azospirillum oleiclasticum]NYZ14210.1 outer membrane protein assembly factor BamD [Azospirillum oleiclasticum]NYZ21694.1 outer membrane protein assembly factor BamD [Azospirillum oleiclasticum]